MPTTVSGSYPAVNSDSDATINGLTVGRGAGAIATNTAVGSTALNANTTGSNNTAVGYQAGYFNTTGIRIVAVGNYALYGNTTGNYNVAMGYEALAPNTTGSNNTAIGHTALSSNTTASNNTAVGYQAGYTNTTGGNFTAVGKEAGYTYNSTTENWGSTFVGLRSGQFTTTGNDNAFVGGFAGRFNTTGSYNVALGASSLYSNTTASNNTAVGYQAGYSNTTASGQTFIGYKAGFNATGANNTAIGLSAGTSITTGTGNTLVGSQAGQSMTTGVQNTFIGGAWNTNGAGYYVTTGSKNTIIGGYDGNQGGLDIRTSSNFIVLSDGDGNPRVIHDGTALIVASSTTSAYSNRAFQVNGAFNNSPLVTVQYTSSGGTPQIAQFYIAAQAPNNTSSVFLECGDNAANRILLRSNGGIANYSGNNVNLSDAREKTNVELAGSYLDKICAIPVKTFNYIDQNREEDDGLTLGVIAQDVQAVAPELVMESNWANENEPEKMRLSIYQTDLQYALMKAIQELKAEVDSLKQQLGK